MPSVRERIVAQRFAANAILTGSAARKPCGANEAGQTPGRTCNLCFHNIFIIRRNVYPVDVDDRLSVCVRVRASLRASLRSRARRDVVVQLGIVISVRKVVLAAR